MVLLSTLGILCFQGWVSALPDYRESDADELMQLCRFADQRGVFAGIITLHMLTLNINVSKKAQLDLAREYHMQYGVDVSKLDKNHRIIIPFPTLSISAPRTPEANLTWSQGEANWSIKKAFEMVQRHRVFLPNDKIYKVSYKLRPWITTEGRRSDTVIGRFYFLRGSSKHQAFFNLTEKEAYEITDP
ncbi:hypothetical protein [Fimbriimonas ginsengisoli]|uniref:hypothetical protein n=1 Tax=Fimbriimonas ginsengisoli TaxID=1005039 RepID=UPI00046D2B41|nr:hypothetical protein [Fimbriimonas ginsengisoli]